MNEMAIEKFQIIESITDFNKNKFDFDPDLLELVFNIAGLQ